MASVTLHNADNSKIEISPDWAILSDPPYGCANDCDYTRFSGGISPSRNHHKGIIGDNQPFDPSRWLNHQHVVLFGYQHFAQRLPVGTLLVWNKKRAKGLGKFLSDCEIAWWNKGKGCYLFNHVWNGFDRESERGEKTLHPSQKPIAVWEWIIQRMKLPPGATICDPFMGAGSCGIAAKRLGYDFVGIEIEKQYFNAAKSRIGKA